MRWPYCSFDAWYGLEIFLTLRLKIGFSLQTFYFSHIRNCFRSHKEKREKKENLLQEQRITLWLRVSWNIKKRKLTTFTNYNFTVKNYNFTVKNYNFTVKNYNFTVKITILQLKITILNLQITILQLQITILQLQITATCEIHVKWIVYNLQCTKKFAFHHGKVWHASQWTGTTYVGKK
jgi:hypothetical protein